MLVLAGVGKTEAPWEISCRSTEENHGTHHIQKFHIPIRTGETLVESEYPHQENSEFRVENTNRFMSFSLIQRPRHKFNFAE